MKRKKSGYELVLWGCLHIHRNPSSGGVSGSAPTQGTGGRNRTFGRCFWCGQALVWAGGAGEQFKQGLELGLAASLVAGSRGLWHCG